MKNYITKLYQKVGVQKGFFAYEYCDEDNYSGMPIYSGKSKFFTSYEQAEKEDYFIPYYVEEDEETYFNYPEFTAERQLKLFLLLSQNCNLCVTNLDDKIHITTPSYINQEYFSTFADAIADYAYNNIKYYDKSLIKKILE